MSKTKTPIEFDKSSKKIMEFMAETRMMFAHQSYDLWLQPHSIWVTMNLKISKTELVKRLKLLSSLKYLKVHKEFPLYKLNSKYLEKYTSNFE